MPKAGRDLSALCLFSVLAFGLSPSSLAGDDPLSRPITPEERQHWAFQPPRKPRLPKVDRPDWARNPIDLFVLSRLQTEGLKPAAEADRSTLLRRVSFDLTGLPPTPSEARAFLADKSVDAYERVVDRLLASPRLGERWAQHWLDLARYADTDGFEFDQARPDAWRYRDWVVSALNADMPYDRFVRLQIAGDELEPDEPMSAIATGFSRCYPDMVDLNDQGLRRQNALNDITETTGLVFLGLTIGCARCHDHKFDPIRQSDFYRLQAFFSPSHFRDDYPLATEADRSADRERRGKVSRSIAEFQSALLQIEAPWRAALSPGPPPGLDDDTSLAMTRPASERADKETRLVFEAWRRDRRIRPEVFDTLLRLDPWMAIARGGLLRGLKSAEAELPSRLPAGRVLVEDGVTESPTHFLIRGDYENRGPKVGPMVPSVLRSEREPTVPIEPRGRSSGRRAALAEWLTRPDNPLAARVVVNRLWQRHFGGGLVATPSDFGVMGEEPSHPELLDWLALELHHQGDHLKALHRLMVTSATYRQASTSTKDSLETDPENLWLSRFRRTRLDGEAIRDALLSVSGRLSPMMGGSGVFPELPSELTKLSSKGAVWPVSATAEERSRRSLYVFIRRNLRYPFFEAFDRPDTNASCPERATTTIAPQALTLLNGQLSADAARDLAERVEREAGGSLSDKVRLAYLFAFAREPGPEDLRDALAFLRKVPELRQYCLALLNANEFLYID